MLKYLLEKEFKQIVRNTFLSKMMVILPIMTIVVFPYVTSQEVTDVKVCIVDNDRSQASQRLAQKVEASGCFSVAGYEPTYGKAMKGIEEGSAASSAAKRALLVAACSADIVLEIPRGFAKSRGRGEEPQVTVAANSVNGVRGGLGSQYLSAVIAAFAAEEGGSEARAAQGMAAGAGPATLYRYNPTLDYKVFMVPGLIAVLITLLCCALTALNIVGEKEAGTIEQINVTPVPKSLFILAKLMPNWAIGLLSLSFGVAFAWAVHGISPLQGLPSIVLFSAVYILVASAMGMVISNYSDTMQQAMFLMFFFLILMMLTCGLFTPIESMPEWAQKITTLNPMRYFTRAMRLAYLRGSSPAELARELMWLGGFAVVLNAWAVASYKKSN